MGEPIPPSASPAPVALPDPPIDARARCPCCGHPTLSERATYDICELCDWEDDGQDDPHADEVRGGPNTDYSLGEARRNFQRFRVMYEPDRDMRIAPDSPLEHETKGLLMEAFDRRASASSVERGAIDAGIARLEAVLAAETRRKVEEFERRFLDDA